MNSWVSHETFVCPFCGHVWSCLFAPGESSRFVCCPVCNFSLEDTPTEEDIAMAQRYFENPELAEQEYTQRLKQLEQDLSNARTPKEENTIFKEIIRLKERYDGFENIRQLYGSFRNNMNDDEMPQEWL